MQSLIDVNYNYLSNGNYKCIIEAKQLINTIELPNSLKKNLEYAYDIIDKNKRAIKFLEFINRKLIEYNKYKIYNISDAVLKDAINKINKEISQFYDKYTEDIDLVDEVPLDSDELKSVYEEDMPDRVFILR